MGKAPLEGKMTPRGASDRWEASRGMAEAYILVQTSPGTGPGVTKAVSNIKGVGSAVEVTRPYDVIARAEARTPMS